MRWIRRPPFPLGLIQANGASRETIKAREDEIKSLLAEREKADAAFEEARSNYSDLTIIAPAAGVVTTRITDEGEVVAAGTPLMEIVDIDRLYLKAYVPENLIIMTPSSGTGLVAGADMRRARREIKERIGYMSQFFSLYHDLTVIENIMLYAGIYGLWGFRAFFLAPIIMISGLWTPPEAMPGWLRMATFFPSRPLH
ncbi:MAG: efflux RND transporter periplasmic adaptor subunit [Nitrospiraceae bacterium]|nr:efflux RND transporter periplasmic adaptor subunit [Nitrospiraceae bacterium]